MGHHGPWHGLGNPDLHLEGLQGFFDRGGFADDFVFGDLAGVLGGQQQLNARELPAAVLLWGRGYGGHPVRDANKRLLAPGGRLVGLFLGRRVADGILGSGVFPLGVGAIRRSEPWAGAGVGGRNNLQQTTAQEANGLDQESPGPQHGFGAPGRRGQAVGQSQHGGHGQNEERWDITNRGSHGRPDQPADCAAARGLALVGSHGGKVGHGRQRGHEHGRSDEVGDVNDGPPTRAGDQNCGANHRARQRTQGRGAAQAGGHGCGGASYHQGVVDDQADKRQHSKGSHDEAAKTRNVPVFRPRRARWQRGGLSARGHGRPSSVRAVARP